MKQYNYGENKKITKAEREKINSLVLDINSEIKNQKKLDSDQLDKGHKFQPFALEEEKTEVKQGVKLLLGKIIKSGDEIVVRKYSHVKEVKTVRPPRKKFANDEERIEDIFHRRTPLMLDENGKKMRDSFGAIMYDYEAIKDTRTEICRMRARLIVNIRDYIKVCPCKNVLVRKENLLVSQYESAVVELKKNKVKSKKYSVNRSRNTVLAYAKCNPQLKYFSTLTYAENVTDYDIAYADWQQFLNKVRKFMKRKYDMKFEYVATFERQKRGAWHVHILHNLENSMFSETDIQDDVNGWVVKGWLRKKTEERKIIENDFNKRFWNKGFVDFRRLYDSTGSARYLSKYMTKDTEEVFTEMAEEGSFKKRYYCSQNLKKPTVIDIDLFDSEEIVEENNRILKEIEDIDKVSMLIEKDKKNSTIGGSALDTHKMYEKRINVYKDYTTVKDRVQGIQKMVQEIVYNPVRKKEE